MRGKRIGTDQCDPPESELHDQQAKGRKRTSGKDLIFADQGTGLFMGAMRHTALQPRKPSLQRKKVDAS